MIDYSLTFVITASREEESKTLRKSLGDIQELKKEGKNVKVHLNLDKIEFDRMPKVDLVTHYELKDSFAELRNPILSHVTTDFFFILDADEFFLNMGQCYKEIMKCLEWNMLVHSCECVCFPANHMQEWHKEGSRFTRQNILNTIPAVKTQSDFVEVEDKEDYIKFSKMFWPSMHRRLFNRKSFLGYGNLIHEHPGTKLDQAIAIPFSENVVIQHLKSFDQQHLNHELYTGLAK